MACDPAVSVCTGVKTGSVTSARDSKIVFPFNNSRESTRGGIIKETLRCF